MPAAFDATTDHVFSVIRVGRDDIANTFTPPEPPTIQSGAPLAFVPPRPYATVSAEALVPVNGVYNEDAVLY